MVKLDGGASGPFVKQLRNEFKNLLMLGVEALEFELGGFLSVALGGQLAQCENEEGTGELDICMMVESLKESLNFPDTCDVQAFIWSH